MLKRLAAVVALLAATAVVSQRRRLGANAKQRAGSNEDEQRRQRVAVIAEFDTDNTDATLHAMAAEILRYRRIIVAWAQAGTPFAALGPNPLWQLQSVCGTSRDDAAASRDEERLMTAVSSTLEDVHGIKVECGNGRKLETVEALLSARADGNPQPAIVRRLERRSMV